MKIIIRNSFIAFFAILLVANAYIFVSSMYLGDEINRFDSQIKSLVQENSVLEKKVYEAESLQYAATLSTRLNFTVQSQPVYFENLKYALNR